MLAQIPMSFVIRHPMQYFIIKKFDWIKIYDELVKNDSVS